MNFLCKLSKFRTIFFYAVFFHEFNLCALSTHNHELGLPRVQNIFPFSSPEILQYNSIAQDSKGFIFIGGNNGILRYDGNYWQQLNLQGPVSVCSDLNGKIIAGGKNYFGVIDYLPDGSMHYTSLYYPEQNDYNAIGSIRNIFPLNGNLILQTSNGIFIWNQLKLNPVNVPELPGCVLSKGDTLIMHIPGYGLYSMYDSVILPVKPGECLAEFDVSDMIDFNNQLLIYTEEKGFLIFNNGKLQNFNSELNQFFSEHGYSDGIYHKKGQLILAAKDGSLVFYDPVYKTTLYIKEGLPGTRINYLYEGKPGNLWLLYDFNLTRIEWPSAFSFFDSRNGLYGNIGSIIRFENNIYVSSSQGIYILEKEVKINSPFTVSKFTEINNSGFNCSQLLDCGKILLGISDNGIVRITENNSCLIYPGKVNVLFQSISDPEIVLAGTNDGLIALNISSDNYNTSRIAVSLSLPVWDIIESNDRSLWISCGNSGLVRFNPTDGFTSDMSYTVYDTTNGLPDKTSRISFEDVNNKLLFSTNSGFYYLDAAAKKFFPYSPLKIPAVQGKDITTIPLYKDSENNIWMKVSRQGTNETEIWKAEFCGVDSFKLSRLNIIRFRDQIVRSVYAGQDSIIWIGGQDQLIRYDTRSFDISRSDFSVHIFNIKVNDEYYITPDPGISQAGFKPAPEPVKISFSQNTIRFSYLSTSYSDEGKGLFQYMLDGYNNNWSEWSVQSITTFHNLSIGTYTFYVRSQDIFGNISSAEQFRFRIAAPLCLKWWAILIYFLILLPIIYFLRKWKIFRDFQKRYKLEEIIRERTEALIKEKEKSENLIANILPKITADELKLTGKATSSKFKMVTVLFADIQGFTKIAEQMNPEKLIDELDRFYFQFDSVVDKYNIEKIKTIGDAYMAAGGIPIKNRTNPVEVVLAALQMQQFMKELKKTKTDIWDLRIGIHTGSVIAGVVGQKKFSYDIWGDTVNTASRMESSGEIGKVNISATTYELVKDFFQCQYRGKMPVKYKGDIEMYFVTGIKPKFQADNDITPNDDFLIHLQDLRLLDLEEFILQKLKNELPDTLYFHNSRHTSHVHYQAELLGRSENISPAELLLVRSAALCHDIGYIDTIEEHERRSVEMAREILPLYRYSEGQIDEICKLILATRMPPNPTNVMERIICDANFDHIGRVDFLIESDRLFQENRTLGKINSKKEWNEIQIDFLKKIDFFTTAAQKMREVTMEQQIQNILKFS
jgi:adenylate cyclase